VIISVKMHLRVLHLISASISTDVADLGKCRRVDYMPSYHQEHSKKRSGLDSVKRYRDAR